MARFTFIVLLALLKSSISVDFECIRNVRHQKQILKEGVSGPYQLVIDHDTNTLFFSYAARTGAEYFKTAYLNLKTNEFGTVSGIQEGFANAVDDKRHEVYMGGQDGIYKFNYETKSATNLGITTNNVWQMFYKDGLYYSTYPDEYAYLYKNGAIGRIPGIGINRALTIAVSQSDNIFFSNSSGLFWYSKADGITDEIADYNVNGFSADTEGNLYCSANRAIYHINESKQEIERILSANSYYGVAIEANGDIIYALDNSIVRLKRTSDECISDSVVTPFKRNQS